MLDDGYVLAGRVDEFREGRGRSVKIAGVDVAVFRVGERFFALEDACPHMGASLADGKLFDGCVECHWHHWKFDLRTGQGDQRSWARAAVYDLRVVDDGVWLKPPQVKDPEPVEAGTEDDEEWMRADPESFFRKKTAESDRRTNGEERADQTDHQSDDEQ